MERQVKIALIIVLGVIVIAAIFASMISNLAPTETISVNGQTQIEVLPNLVTTYFTIENKADTASEARSDNGEVYESFVSSLLAIGIEESEIKTTNLQVTQNYEWEDNKMIDKGYIARHDIKIELPINEKDMVGEVLDAGVNAGALINYVNFELSENLREEKKAEAIQKATEDARIKAESIADGLGAELGKIVSVSDSGFDYYPWPLFERDKAVTSAAEAGSSADMATKDINPSEQTVYANVNVIYKIK